MNRLSSSDLASMLANNPALGIAHPIQPGAYARTDGRLPKSPSEPRSGKTLIRLPSRRSGKPSARIRLNGKGSSGQSRPQKASRDYKAELLQQIALCGLPDPIPEYKFHPTRRWRWDFAFVTQKVAIEYQGGIYHAGKQGHQTTAGIERDCLKFSEGAALGWRLLPINAGMVRSGKALKLIEKALTIS